MVRVRVRVKVRLRVRLRVKVQREPLARAVRLLAVHDGGEGQGGLARDEDVQPAEVVLAVARDRILHRGVALGGRVKRGGGVGWKSKEKRLLPVLLTLERLFIASKKSVISSASGMEYLVRDRVRLDQLGQRDAVPG